MTTDLRFDVRAQRNQSRIDVKLASYLTCEWAAHLRQFCLLRSDSLQAYIHHNHTPHIQIASVTLHLLVHDTYGLNLHSIRETLGIV